MKTRDLPLLTHLPLTGTVERADHVRALAAYRMMRGMADKMVERVTRWRARRERIKEAMKYHEQRDPRENAETRLPDDEIVDLHSIWVAEVYTPSQVPAFLQGLHALGWDRGSSIALEDLDLADWVRQSRASPFGGGWINLPTIARPGDTGWLGARRGPLPEGVRCATGTLQSPTPGMTVFVMQFVLDASLRRAIDDVFRRDFESQIVRPGGALQILNPKNLKHEALKAGRREVRHTCSKWFREYLPGAFSGGLGSGAFPTIDVITTEVAKPFRLDRDERAWYTWALGIDHDFDAWESIDLSPLMLQLPQSSFDDVQALSLIANRAQLFADPKPFEGYGDGNDRLLWWLATSLDGTMVVWALHQLLVGYQDALGRLRDDVHVDHGVGRKVVGELQKMRSSLLTTVGDAAQTATEIRELEGTDRSPVGDVLDFTPASEYRKSRQGKFVSELTASNRSLARTVATTETHVRGMLSTDADAIGAIANIKVQSSLRVLTVVLIVLGVLTLTVAVLQVWLLVLGTPSG